MSRESTIADSPAEAGLPFGFDGREIRLASIGWGLFVLCQAAYCAVYTRVVATTSWELRDMVRWALTEWGLWLVLTPLVFRTARRHDAWLAGGLSRYLTLAAATLAVSLPVRVAIQVALSEAAAVPSFVVYLPRHLAAVAAILLVWRLFLRPASDPSTTSPPPAVSAATEAPSPRWMPEDEPEAVIAPVALLTPTPPSPDRAASLATAPPGETGRRAANARETFALTMLRVSKGRDECLIRVDEIEYVTASGNYVDIGCAGQVYLLRATMKHMEARLPAAQFLRVHRRHFVNLQSIERISWRRSGNGVLRLKSGHTLNVSKTYKGNLHHPEG